MSYPFIDLDKSKKQELVLHLKEYCGVEKKETDSKEELMNAVLEFEENTGLIRPAELMPKRTQQDLSNSRTEPVESVKLSNDLNTYRKVRIKIHADHHIGGQYDVIVWLNGRSFQIQREQEVDVPEPVYKLLLDAKSMVADQQKDGSIKERVVQNYNISFLGYVE